MRRRRPFIPQRRRIFLGCEGASERAYAALLQSLIDERRRDIHIDAVLLQPGAGDPLALVLRASQHIEADRRRRGFGYARHALLLDADRLGQSPDRDAEARRRAAGHDIHFVWQSPCHEALLLRHIEGCERLKLASADQAVAELKRRWPGYEKAMPAMQLRHRFSWPDVARASRHDEGLRLFLLSLGLSLD